jgi:FAD/FMN-containing dehydrogenase
LEKQELMPWMFSDTDMQQMWKLKLTFDPTKMMNPGKIFPSTFIPSAAKGA